MCAHRHFTVLFTTSPLFTLTFICFLSFLWGSSCLTSVSSPPCISPPLHKQLCSLPFPVKHISLSLSLSCSFLLFPLLLICFPTLIHSMLKHLFQLFHGQCIVIFRDKSASYTPFPSHAFISLILPLSSPSVSVQMLPIQAA